MAINDIAATNVVTNLIGEYPDEPLKTPLPPKAQPKASLRQLFTGARVQQPILYPPGMGPTTLEPTAISQPPIAPMKPLVQREIEQMDLPFWQRALQVFGAPFEWIDNNIIEPGLGLIADPFIPDVEREAGEDFWGWKERSWEEWQAPGVTFDMPWGKWRLDLKGIAELAPWLLVPGVGTVGRGAKAAAGIAGYIGRFGTIGRAIGTAVEFSPWGLVEKTAGKGLKYAIKGGLKVSEKVSTKVGEKLFGKIPEKPSLVTPEANPDIVRLGKLFKEQVGPARKELKKGTPSRIARIEATMRAWAEKEAKGEISLSELSAREVWVRSTRKSLSAELAAKMDIPEISDDAMQNILSPLRKAAESEHVYADLSQAMKETLAGIMLPEPHHIKAFAKIYGDDFANAVKDFADLTPSLKDKIIDILNIPRALLASGDVSGTFRQGLFLVLTHPGRFPRAFARQMKFFASEKMSLEMDDALRSDAFYKTAVENMGVQFKPMRMGAELVAKEEPFMSNFAELFPFVRRSERAFTGFLNEMKMGAAKDAYGTMVAQKATPEQLKLMGEFINLASGLGKLPKDLNKLAPALSTVLFSPKYQLSIMQMPRQLGRMYLSKNPYMRRQAAQALITFVLGGSALLGLLKVTGVSDKIEMDPRSGDFGKIKIGETRLDIWRGYLQYIRFANQLAFGERKTAYGNLNKAERDEIILRFIQSKLSPAAGLFADIWKGESYMGEPLFNETTGFIKMARDRLLPLALQDTIDAMEQNGVNALWTAIPATTGIGVLTYVNDFVKVKEKIAKEAGYQTWDEIDPKTQRKIENRNIELQTAFLELDRRVMGTAWGDWGVAGRAIEEVFTENVNQAVQQYRQGKDGVQFREKISDAFTARRGGYDARSSDSRFEEIVNRLNLGTTKEALAKLGPEQLAIKVYNEALYGDDMYDQFGDYMFDEAEKRKAQLKQQLGNELFLYVEEYRGLKYENLPYEFHELTKAKQILKPYWRIKDDVLSEMGTPTTKTAQLKVDREITKRRKLLREQNPELDRYYRMFYSREEVLPTTTPVKLNLARLLR